jgi:hypothetical protein
VAFLAALKDADIKFGTMRTTVIAVIGSYVVWTALPAFRNSIKALPRGENLRPLVDLKFKNNDIVLAQGRYWIAMGFTGSPIVDWFFTYGKLAGPQDGTRYKTIFDETWRCSLAFEFNYKVERLALLFYLSRYVFVDVGISEFTFSYL